MFIELEIARPVTGSNVFEESKDIRVVNTDQIVWFSEAKEEVVRVVESSEGYEQISLPATKIRFSRSGADLSHGHPPDMLFIVSYYWIREQMSTFAPPANL